MLFYTNKSIKLLKMNWHVVFSLLLNRKITKNIEMNKNLNLLYPIIK